MSISQIFTQVVVIFLLMLLGVVIRKLGFLHSQSINDLTNIILYFLSPIVIIKAFEQPFSRARFNQFLVLVVAVFLTYFVSILLASLLFRRVRDQNIRRIAIYGSILTMASWGSPWLRDSSAVSGSSMPWPR